MRYQTRRSHLSSNFFSSEVHDKGDPFQVRRHWATLGEFGQMTSRQCLYQKYTTYDILFDKINLWVRFHWLKEIIPSCECNLGSQYDVRGIPNFLEDLVSYYIKPFSKLYSKSLSLVKNSHNACILKDQFTSSTEGRL